MICAVCLNPCIDRTVEIDKFTYGGMNRILTSREDGCGKGVNVALVARQMGMESACIGYLFEDNGALISERLKDAGAGEDCIWLPGRVRTNMKVFDRENSRITEINESGAFISEADRARMIELVRDWAGRCDTMVFTGSLPPGCPADFYKTLMEATEGRCRCVLDAGAGMLHYDVMDRAGHKTRGAGVRGRGRCHRRGVNGRGRRVHHRWAAQLFCAGGAS